MKMTREEAIQNREDCLKYLEGIGKKASPGCVEAMRWSVKALKAFRPVSREQVEKVWRGEWVKRHKHQGGFRRVKGIDDMGEQHEVTVNERCEYDDLYCSKCGKQSPDNFLNFCGYCGAPITDEAVEMVMERLEALKDGPEQ